MRNLIIVCLLIPICPLSAAGQLQPPSGYRFPTDADIIDDWKESNAPIQVDADFNGDGQEDHARILLRQYGPGWGIFVYLGRKDQPPRLLRLSLSKGEALAQRHGIALAPPSSTQWKTACGKGYFECKPGEPEQVRITLPSIEFCYIGSSCFLFMWNKKAGSFRKIQLSD